jgi:hypothetical protein
MRIEIIDKEGNEIQNLTLESNPFNIGQIIHLNINNRNKEYWEVKEINSSFKVENIEHYVRVDYSFNGSVSEVVSVSIEVSLADA